MRTGIDLKTSLIIIFCSLLFFMIIPNNDQGYDSYSYSIAVRDGGDLFHPHHLLYHLFGFLFFKLFSFTGLGSMKILSMANSLFGAITLMIVFKIIRYRTSEYMAAIGTVMTGFLFSFWYYATSVEVNMPALMFLCLALYYLIGKPKSGSNSMKVYIFIAAGILFHQIVALAVIPILIYDFTRYKSFAKIIRYAFPGLAGGFAIYLIVAITQAETVSIDGIYKWLTFYGHLDAWGTLGTSNFSGAIWGKLKTFFGGDLIRQIFYAGERSIATIAYLSVIAAIWLGLIWMFIMGIVQLRVKSDSFSWLLLSLVVVYGIFSFWWAPTDDGFWLYQAVILMVFVFISAEKKLYTNWLVSIMVAMLVIVNLSCEFIPSSNRSNSYIYQGVEAFDRLKLTEDDLVITNFSQIRLAYEYHKNIHVPTVCMMYLEPGDNEDVIAAYHDRIAQALKSGRVIIFDDEIRPEPSRKYLFNRFSPEEYASTYKIYQDNLTPVDSIMIHGRNVQLYELEAVN
ncbi:MAG: glycosyltransferase family 39 protein [candidate division Zixibacteria bacterium]|nr:glycosyltransferase family 39 protein [candidate division Zixibacteria bacterium]